jgi:putative peptide zinc metalloprotease protein
VSISSPETRRAAPRLTGPGNGQVVFPERPSLAPGVTLAGQMKESAFKEPPWLIEREEAGYVQVPELLYRIAEQCDGTHTVEEIAASASESSGQNLPPDAVHRLIAGQLIQKGLVATGDGKVAIANRLGSPLALNMRMAMVNPRLLDPITRVLQVLYWPPVLLSVLALAAVVQVWLYFIHGVGSSLHDIIYAPGLMLLLLGVIVLSAAFHELGHAAALRYGGGQVKAMGAGLYLVYPAFYTDVSDNYRLSRWARLRTDLGGFYFNMIFALGAMALYVASGQEFLLLIVVLINLEIIHQLFPFLRLDGYWTLVDMTGVPDFFSQMAAFVRRFIPGLRGSGPRLPELKWWANVIFALYILITIPLLAFLFFVIVKGFPRIVATAWDSFLQQKDVLGASLGSGDALGVATAAATPVRGLTGPATGTPRPTTPAPAAGTMAARTAETRPATPPIASASPASTPGTPTVGTAVPAASPSASGG